MKSERKMMIQELKSRRFNKFTHRWSLLYLLITVVFCGLLFTSGLLAVKIMIGAGAIIGFITLLLFPALFSWRFKKGRKVLCFVLSLVMTFVYGTGIAYLAGTLDFFSKITSIASAVEEYYVVVRDDGEFEKIGDIEGQDVFAFKSGEGYSKAVKKLEKKVDVNVVEADDLDTTADDLLTGECDAIFLNSANYVTVTDHYDGFDDYTKILYKIRIITKPEDIAKRVNVTKKPFNVYITGLDTDGDISTQSRSDVNMIATVNPRTKTVLLTSIPRDYYVEVDGTDGEFDKLTHTGLYGANKTVNTVSNMLGIDMNYYVKVNYATVEALVDAMGGITVHSDFEFTTHGQGVYYDYYVGDNELDGAQALAFARERYSFADGDLQRNRNQQAVMKAILKKATGSTTILTKYTSILNAIEDYVETNFTSREIKSLVKMQMNDMTGWKIRTQSITGDVSPDFMPCYALGGNYASVVMQDQDSMDAAVTKIKEVMEE